MIKDNKETYQRSIATQHPHSFQYRGVMLLHPPPPSSSSSLFGFDVLSTINPFGRFLLLDLLLILSVVVLSCFPDSTYASCDKNDQESLLLFWKGISSQPPLNWSAAIDCCEWEGIGCDVDDRVNRLWLPSKGLRGHVSPTIANLSRLAELNLARNLFSGPLPDGLFKALNSLESIDLSYNRLYGEISSLDFLPTTVQTLNLSGNHLNGTIQSSFFQQASNLVSFNISNNTFSGQIPDLICQGSPSVSALDFTLNDFSGSIPKDIGVCLNLEVLRAGFNNLSGYIPNEIYRVSSLQQLSIPANKLGGTIDESIANLINIRILSLYGNDLTGGIPQNIGALSHLEELLLHINRLNGTLPPSLMNCTRLKTLNLRVNHLEGELSAFDFSKLIQLGTIDMGNNLFQGKLPASLYSCKTLTAIRLAANKLVGEISPEITALQSLSFLSVSNNSLTNISSAMRILQGCKNIRTIMISKNFFDEQLPADENFIHDDALQNLQVLGLGGCRFTGQIPMWVAKLQMLEAMDISFNKLKGTIPGFFGGLSNLFYLDLSQNFFEGNFPVDLIKMRRLSSQEGGDQVDGSYLELPVFVQPDNASSLQYNQLSNLPPAIYLNNNNLSGNIPKEVGQLKFVKQLDFSNNLFSGSITDTISNLTNLERLDLSRNNLTGQIPSSLKILHFLSFFSVANNNLQGPIPIGGQFDTFPNTSFTGNPGLCGLVIQRLCDDISTTTHTPTSKKSPRKRIILGLALGICFGIAFTLMVLAFWTFTKRRIIPKGDPEKPDMDIASYNSSSGLTEVEKDASFLKLFPNNKSEIKELTIAEILKATNNFNQANIIGCGGFGLVFKAILEDGTKLAVKKLSGDMGLMEREFKAEVEILSTAQHKNLVSLQGYCVHDGSRLLIYSFMENGSLDYWLHEKADGASKLDWPTRLKIARGASYGLAYMHQVCEPHIVHRDIKSSNILLDDKFEAHVADFGLSRIILPHHTHVTTELVGTLGYIPPEYGQAWVATLRGDVYSFGVVLLELLTGTRPVDITRPKMTRELVVWVQQMKNEGKQVETFDPLLRGKGYEDEMLQVFDVACVCVSHNPFKRPSIAEVVNWLNGVGCKQQTEKGDQENK
ncbi:hypothetical protein Leryth_027694 [Lithospermum erythrorhizon]|nr:hypothetical protein Leryth_027694 [Lithospermum erythrorhizon]